MPLECLQHSLTYEERDAILALLERDGYAILPRKLPADDVVALQAATLTLANSVREGMPTDGARSVKIANVVDAHPTFLELAMYPPALQLAYDSFGCGAFHLNQSNCVARVREAGLPAFNFVSASPWHADGPRPAAKGSPFPSPQGAQGAVGLHYIKFGYFFTDLTHGTGGSLQVVRGSHMHAELDGRGGSAAGQVSSTAAPGAFDPAHYHDDIVKLDCAAGTIVVFHQAQWHAALPNESDVERLNAYVSYCPTWMRPVDRDFPSVESLAIRGLMGTPAGFLLGEPRPPQRWWVPSLEPRRVWAGRVPGGFAGKVRSSSGCHVHMRLCDGRALSRQLITCRVP